MEQPTGPIVTPVIEDPLGEEMILAIIVAGILLCALSGVGLIIIPLIVYRLKMRGRK